VTSDTTPYETLPESERVQEACPFCGAWLFGLRAVQVQDRTVCCVVCLRCGCAGPDCVHTTKEQAVSRAIAIWNDRRPADADRERWTQGTPIQEEP